jgi:hypothetical protein
MPIPHFSDGDALGPPPQGFRRGTAQPMTRPGPMVPRHLHNVNYSTSHGQALRRLCRLVVNKDGYYSIRLDSKYDL